MTPEELSGQGKRMFHMRGGYAVQRRYRMENRDPLARARHTLKYIRAREKKRDEARMLERVGLYFVPLGSCCLSARMEMPLRG
jgi:hypothetical protein